MENILGLKLASDGDQEVWEGEFVKYNCTKSDKPVTGEILPQYV